MKKGLFVLSLFLVVSLSGCSTKSENINTSQATNEESEKRENIVPFSVPSPTPTPLESPTPEPTPTPTPEPTPTPIPVVTYDEILSGDYNNQDVYIKCVLSKIEYIESIEHFEFDAWIYNDDNYILDEYWSVYMDEYDVDNISDLLNAKDGDLFKIRATVYEDSSFGFSDVLYAKSLKKSVNLEKIFKQYKESCGTYTCEEILRTPEKYSDTYMKFSGEVFQIISEEEDSVEFLISTKEKNGYVYVSYDIPLNGVRILEGDNITAYGIYYKLYEYDNLLGSSKKIPELFAQFVNIN